MQHWYNERQIGMLYNDTIAYLFNVPKYGVVSSMHAWEVPPQMRKVKR